MPFYTRDCITFCFRKLNRVADSGVTPEIRVCYGIANGNVYADLMNTGKSACTFTITSLAYRTDGPWQVKLAGTGTDFYGL
ncbi:hypothetical protein GCM10027093_61580 [Paraburkholderia jirisanensis]